MPNFNAEDQLSTYLGPQKFSALVIITDQIVGELYLEKIKFIINKNINNNFNLKLDHYILPVGEKYKTRESKQSIENFLLSNNYNKNICLLALGGGVITDLTGFIAATYYRGVPVIYYPTTLLAMVDAAIGGKTAVNTEYGKNLIGLIKQPDLVVIDLDCLTSLPEQGYRSAFAEIIKHALIADRSYFDYLYNNYKILINRDINHPNYLNILQYIITKSHEIKLNIVKQDEHEQSGLRHLLNFGHTIGHAIEAASDYNISHGYAVAMGIIIESYLSLKYNFLSEADYSLIYQIMRLFKLDFDPDFNSGLNLEQIIDYLHKDKKNTDFKINFVLLEAIGKGKAKQGIEIEKILPIIRAFVRLTN
ncbi:MAG: 3-dehydroquinate synthase [Gammaproteobacteria bacterium]|nr:3-dehydroquinate synthase [Gammaproteobacteria bacterium]